MSSRQQILGVVFVSSAGLFIYNVWSYLTFYGDMRGDTFTQLIGWLLVGLFANGQGTFIVLAVASAHSADMIRRDSKRTLSEAALGLALITIGLLTILGLSLQKPYDGTESNALLVFGMAGWIFFNMVVGFVLAVSGFIKQRRKKRNNT